MRAPKGKRRPKGGRPKGSRNKRTLEQQAMVEHIQRRGKKSPLEVMLYACEKMQRTAEKYAREGDGSKAVECMKLAVDFASKAAPYVHNRLASIDHTTGGKEFPQPQINVVFVDEDDDDK